MKLSALCMGAIILSYIILFGEPILNKKHLNVANHFCERRDKWKTSCNITNDVDIADVIMKNFPNAFYCKQKV